MSNFSLPSSHIQTVVEMALAEDLSNGDVTTRTLIPSQVKAQGRIIARQAITVAGVEIARAVFSTVDSSVKVACSCEDGQSVLADTTILTVHGPARSLLMGERVALNFLQRLSGIATLTAQFCEAIRGYPTQILDTRKTTPGLRVFEKWAVSIGGGSNHRFSLSDGLLIKDNHLAVLFSQGIGLAQACRQARERGPHGLRIAVEVGSLDQIPAALEGKTDIILLDNMSPEMVGKAVSLIKGRAMVEVSGGVSLQNVRDLAAAGADWISIGALTHSAKAVDINMDIFPQSTDSQKKSNNS